MNIEQRHDNDLSQIAETQEQRQRTLDAAIGDMLRAVEGIGRRLDELLVKHEAAQKAQHFAELEAHLNQRTRRADFFDDRAGRLRA
ncbi:MAG: hypothetical protein OEM15_11940 [Myxococcales bacterium]|nr:hypothetical protein [Myxococcales bacterium]MDH3484487.1 hypothetical protein [Myxococcales bacterium]